MKKFFFFAATVFVAAVAVSSCEKKVDPPASQTAVTTAKENLVLHIGFEAADELAAGVSVDNLYGGGVKGTGFYGDCYVNTTADNETSAYEKFNLAAGNPFTKLESMTFTCWVKLPAGKPAKGGLISFNGTGVEDVWPSFIYLFDNSWTDEETGLEIQQFNGRIDFLTVEGKPAMWPNSQDNQYAKKDTWFQIARTYDANTGHWANYANGIIVNEGDFLIDEKPVGGIKAAFASDCNAFYVGGWASRIEGKTSEAWQNYFPGSIDEIRVFNKALSEAEILSLYKEELALSLDQK